MKSAHIVTYSTSARTTALDGSPSSPATETSVVARSDHAHVEPTSVATDVRGKVDDIEKLLPVAMGTLYPHVFDEHEGAGLAIASLRLAHVDATRALAAFGEADLDAVQTRLGHVAAALAKAARLNDFNPSFGAVVGFVRRAVLIAMASEVSRSSLNALVNVVATVEKNPMLSLMEAAELTQQMEREGWNGQHAAVERLAQALLEPAVLDQVAQSEMFESKPAF